MGPNRFEWPHEGRCLITPGGTKGAPSANEKPSNYFRATFCRSQVNQSVKRVSADRFSAAQLACAKDASQKSWKQVSEEEGTLKVPFVNRDFGTYVNA